jgi:hypothetical protein
MEGGIAILLLLVLVVVIGGAAFGLFGVGGGLSLWRRSDAKKEPPERPEHKRPTTPYHEHTRFVGSAEDLDRTDEPARPPQH